VPLPESILVSIAHHIARGSVLHPKVPPSQRATPDQSWRRFSTLLLPAHLEPQLNISLEPRSCQLLSACQAQNRLARNILSQRGQGRTGRAPCSGTPAAAPSHAERPFAELLADESTAAHGVVLLASLIPIPPPVRGKVASVTDTSDDRHVGSCQ
jgi:hypothetical protein